MDSNKLKLRLDDISKVNPALTCYHRDDPAPVSYTHLTLPTNREV